MKLIVGFGNPGSQYNFARHNFGFLALDFYAKVKGLDWEKSEKYHAKWLKFKDAAGEDVILIKPQTFYNESGVSVAGFAKFYKVALEDILVLSDDFWLEFGRMRFREKGSDGGNNGLKSVIKELGADNFRRLRLGTGNDELRKKMGDKDFVLSKFLPEEKAKLPEILGDVVKRIDEIICRCGS